MRHHDRVNSIPKNHDTKCCNRKCIISMSFVFLPVDDCENDYCENGKCSQDPVSHAPECTCEEGFIGERCQLWSRECTALSASKHQNAVNDGLVSAGKGRSSMIIAWSVGGGIGCIVLILIIVGVAGSVK